MKTQTQFDLIEPGTGRVVCNDITPMEVRVITAWFSNSNPDVVKTRRQLFGKPFYVVPEGRISQGVFSSLSIRAGLVIDVNGEQI